VIDYLQLMRSPSRRGQENRQVEVSEISAGIKSLAKELKVPVVVLAQLNRNPDTRAGDTKGRPKLSDLRESGSIEQDADVVALLWRAAYYKKDEEEKKEAEGLAELEIAKNRNGPVDGIPLTFLKNITRFESRASE
jgi:replicative DNA helicase